MFRPPGRDVIFLDPDVPIEEAVLLVALAADVPGDAARGWVSCAYAQDPRRTPAPPADGPEAGGTPPPVADLGKAREQRAFRRWRFPWAASVAYPRGLGLGAALAVVVVFVRVQRP